MAIIKQYKKSTRLSAEAEIDGEKGVREGDHERITIGFDFVTSVLLHQRSQ
jgi:hypothetical protein